MAKYMNSRSDKSKVVYTHSLSKTDCLLTHCHLEFSRHTSTITTNVCIAPISSQYITPFFDSFPAFIVPFLKDNLHIIVGEFGFASIDH